MFNKGRKKVLGCSLSTSIKIGLIPHGFTKLRKPLK